MSTAREPAQVAVEVCLARMQAIVRRRRASREELATVAGWLGDRRKAVQRCAAQTLAGLVRQHSVVCAMLRERLGHGPAHAQWGAIYAFALMDRLPADALPVLLGVLGSHDGDVRWAAVHMLVRLKGEPGVAVALRAVVRAGDAMQRKMAAYCLRDCGFATPETESALIDRMSDEHPEVRLAAVSGVARLACDRARVTRKLLAMIFDDPSPGVCRAVAVALARVGHGSPEVIAALRRAARGPDLSLRRAAERSLRLLCG